MRRHFSLIDIIQMNCKMHKIVCVCVCVTFVQFNIYKIVTIVAVAVLFPCELWKQGSETKQMETITTK